MPRGRIEMAFKLPMRLKKKEKYYIAICPALDVVTQGETKTEAKKNLVDALSLFIRSCLEHGTLDEVMKESGFSLYKKEPVKPLKTNGDYVRVPIPMHVQPSSSLQSCPA